MEEKIEQETVQQAEPAAEAQAAPDAAPQEAAETAPLAEAGTAPQAVPDLERLLQGQEQLRAELAALRGQWADYLAGTAVRGDTTPQPGLSVPAQHYTAAQLRGMSAEEINLRWDDIRRSMAGGAQD